MFGPVPLLSGRWIEHPNSQLRRGCCFLVLRGSLLLLCTTELVASAYASPLSRPPCADGSQGPTALAVGAPLSLRKG